MFIYNKMTQIPVNIRNKNPKLASFVLSQYGGPDGELGASLRYLSQRYTMPDERSRALLTDIGTEELGHMEMVGSVVSQLTTGEGAKSFDRYGVGAYYVDRSNSVYPQSAGGFPYSAASMAVKGDPIADLVEDMAADAASTQAQPGSQSKTKTSRSPFPSFVTEATNRGNLKLLMPDNISLQSFKIKVILNKLFP